MNINVIELDRLTTAQLATALENGEGLINVTVVSETEPCVVLSHVYVATRNGDSVELATRVKYYVRIEDDTTDEGYIDAVVFVEATRVGIQGMF